MWMQPQLPEETNVTFWTCENLFFYQRTSSFLCGLKDWQIKVQKRPWGICTPNNESSIMTLNPSIGNTSDCSIQVYPSLRNNICLYGVISSLCTYGNTEAWENVYHGSVPYCTRASQKPIYINIHQHAVNTTGNVKVAELNNWKDGTDLQMTSESDTHKISNSIKVK